MNRMSDDVPALARSTGMHLASIVSYPVKSLGGHALPSAVVEARGIAGDRRWMIIDERGRFVTRREVPAMARLDVRPTAEGLTIVSAGGECRAVRPDGSAPAVVATIWRDTVTVHVGNEEADAFLSAALARPVRLAYQPDTSLRAIDTHFSNPGDHVSLADGFPLLITTEPSLRALNDQLAVPVPMERFRPNLVIAGTQPWDEDRWRRIRIGDVTLDVASPCTRCVITTQQPETGERLEGNEPLATLRAIGRYIRSGTIFGQNAIARSGSVVNVGDKLAVLETMA